MIERLKTLESFQHFTDEQIDLLGRCVSTRRVPAQTQIISEGDSSQEAFVLFEGKVRLQRETSYGQFLLATLEPGDLFGELCFIDRNARSVDAATETEVELLVLNPDALATLMERDKAFTVALHWAFWKSLSKKLRTTNDRLTRFFTDSPKPKTEPARGGGASGEYRVDLEAKRALFQEQKLSNMEINFLSTLSKANKLEPGEQIFREGDPGDRMYVVLEGKVMISKEIAGAGEEALAFLERGDFFGEMALIDKEPRSADAKAGDDGAVVLSIPHNVLEGILDINKVSSIRLLQALCRLVAKRLREVNEKIVGWYILAGASSSEGEENPSAR